MCLHFNFLELGHALLAESATWHCPMVLPTEIESCIPGGWSRVFADFLERCFLGDTGMLTSAIPITHGDEGFVFLPLLGLLFSLSD
jgi:hypothetical protein